MYKCISLLIILLSISLSIQIRQVEGDIFEDDQGNLIRYSCTAGGEPLAIYAYDYGSTIDSSIPIKPIYVKEGFVSSDLIPSNLIKANNIDDKGNFHVLTENPALSGLDFKVESTVDHFITAVVFAGAKCDYSNQIMMNYLITTDTLELTDPIPLEQPDYVAHSGIFVYENSKTVDVNLYVWDQLTPWSNAWTHEEQDIYFELTPYNHPHSKWMLGMGIFICGTEARDPTNEELERKNKHRHVIVSKKDLLENLTNMKFLN